MDWLNFIAAMTKALVWPMLVAFALLLFRSQMASLIAQFGRRKVTIKTADNEITISEELDKVEDRQAPLLPDVSRQAIPGIGSSGASIANAQLFRESDANAEFSPDPTLPPAYIISQAWFRIIDTLKLERSSRTKYDREQLTGAAALHLARKEGVLTPSEFEELESLRRVRNEVVHNAGSDVTLTDALRFSALANRIIESIRLKIPNAGIRKLDP